MLGAETSKRFTNERYCEYSLTPFNLTLCEKREEKTEGKENVVWVLYILIRQNGSHTD